MNNYYDKLYLLLFSSQTRKDLIKMKLLINLIDILKAIKEDPKGAVKVTINQEIDLATNKVVGIVTPIVMMIIEDQTQSNKEREDLNLNKKIPGSIQNCTYNLMKVIALKDHQNNLSTHHHSIHP